MNEEIVGIVVDDVTWSGVELQRQGAERSLKAT